VTALNVDILRADRDLLRADRDRLRGWLIAIRDALPRQYPTICEAQIAASIEAAERGDEPPEVTVRPRVEFNPRTLEESTALFGAAVIRKRDERAKSVRKPYRDD
jgi:hypothetical protein